MHHNLRLARLPRVPAPSLITPRSMATTHHYYARNFLAHLRALGHQDEVAELEALARCVDEARKKLWKRTDELFEVRQKELVPLLRPCHKRAHESGLLRVSQTWGWC